MLKVDEKVYNWADLKVAWRGVVMVVLMVALWVEQTVA